MYNLPQRIQEKHGSQVAPEQLASVQKIDEYLAQHRVHELLNVREG